MFIKKKDIEKIEKDLGKNDITLDELRSKAVESRKVVLICGPTCTGKTRLAINLAKIFDTDIISLDSVQVFRGMDIGTDKYDTEKLGIKQYMIDIFEPDYTPSVVEFREICRDVVYSDFFKRSKIPVMAGGSGLYIRAVIDDFDFVSAENAVQDFAYRKILKREIEKNGIKDVYNRLKEIDPDYAEKIGKNDVRRIIRALEVYNITGAPFSSFQNKWNERKSIYNCTIIGLNKENESIKNCINKRVERMLKKGLIDEVEMLIGNGYGECSSLMQAVGYKEVVGFLIKDKKSDIDHLKDSIVKNTRKLVKKQKTWFKADPRINWISVDNYDNMVSLTIGVLKVLWGDL